MDESTRNGGAAGRDFLFDRGFSAEPRYVTDLGDCAPAGAMSYDPQHGRWRLIDYETDALNGTMLVGDPETHAPPVTYPLRAEGLHAVSIGVYGCPEGPIDAAGPGRNYTQLLAKTTDDSTFSILTLTPVPREQGESIVEVFWKVADLTGQELTLGQVTWRVAPGDHPGALNSSPAKIAYVKLVQLTADEAQAWTADQARRDTKRLFVHNDAHGVNTLHRPTTAEEIRRHLEPYRNSDIARLYWECGMGDVAYYLSKIARIPTYDGLTAFGPVQTHNYRLGAESWRAFRDSNVDPFGAACDYAHELGIEFHASYRVAGFHFPPMHDHFDHGASFYKRHPELRGMDRNGRGTPRLSYAYPEVRQLAAAMLTEVAQRFPVDGVCLLYNRRPPLVEYEPPVVEGFQAEYGEDPRQLEDDDPRWLSYRARTLTLFMREVRDAMDHVAEEQGRDRRIEVSAIVVSTEQENLYNAMDLKAWVDQGLVDTLIPYSSEPNVGGNGRSWTDVRDLDYFIGITKGTPCRLAPNIMPRHTTAEDYRRRALALYEAGIEDLFFWDCDILQARLEDMVPWQTLCRLGHREEVEAWRSTGEPPIAAQVTPFTKLADWDLSYATPG